ncbi:hypothetical protein LOK49_LG06G00752 [Camellia lanceoleosa]|uniref:Uncharacterized protein n=1 Tax=Camellia lanceoleosa TaxID=1840588 RepID=A0ACC0HAH7_9ERIC|nr:hypothetical protein LOK49_LG06G00752 [Camellia lanceoleosa]
MKFVGFVESVGSSVQVDLNRVGVPLLEIVSEPDMRTGIEAAEYAAELQRKLIEAMLCGDGEWKLMWKRWR